MSIAEKELLLKKDFDDVYEAGKQAEYDSHWEEVYIGAQRGYYTFAGDGWTNKNFKPNHLIQPTHGYYMFCYSSISGDLRELCELDLSKAYQPKNIFADCKRLTAVGVIDLKAATTGRNENVFNGCISLKTIEKIIFYTYNSMSGMFTDCTSLENITFEKADDKNKIGIGYGVNLSASTLLTHESLISLFDALQDRTGTASLTCNIGATNLAKLTDEEKAIATDKGWILA